jgi:hypothetical protein
MGYRSTQAVQFDEFDAGGFLNLLASGNIHLESLNQDIELVTDGFLGNIQLLSHNSAVLKSLIGNVLLDAVDIYLTATHDIIETAHLDRIETVQQNSTETVAGVKQINCPDIRLPGIGGGSIDIAGNGLGLTTLGGLAKQLTHGVAGPAAALPASPDEYLIIDGYAVPAYAKV